MAAVQPESWLWALITNNNNNTAEKHVAPFDGNVYFLNETSQGTFCKMPSFKFKK
jgi:hypothetical protein